MGLRGALDELAPAAPFPLKSPLIFIAKTDKFLEFFMGEVFLQHIQMIPCENFES
jgi:hypothetical protein